MTDAEALRAFVLVAAGLDPDLERWAVAAVWRGLGAARRRRMRNDLLRQAARRLPPLSAWQKAHALADLAARPCAPGVETAAELVALALAVYPSGRLDRKLSAAQLFRVLRKPPARFSQVASEMEAESVEGIGEMLDNRKRATR